MPTLPNIFSDIATSPFSLKSQDVLRCRGLRSHIAGSCPRHLPHGPMAAATQLRDFRASLLPWRSHCGRRTGSQIASAGAAQPSWSSAATKRHTFGPGPSGPRAEGGVRGRTRTPRSPRKSRCLRVSGRPPASAAPAGQLTTARGRRGEGGKQAVAGSAV